MKSIVEIVNIIISNHPYQINTNTPRFIRGTRTQSPTQQKYLAHKAYCLNQQNEKKSKVEGKLESLEKAAFDFRGFLALFVFLILRQTTMMHHSRLGMMKAYGSRLRQKITIGLRDYSLGKTQQILENLNVQEEEEQEVEISQQEAQIEQQPKQDEEKQGDFNLSDYLQMLSREDLNAFKKENPQLPPIFFMSKAEKKRYFQEINHSFNKKIAKMPQRKSKTKKILKFKNQFEVKPFNEKLKVASLHSVKQVKQKYLPKIHFS